MRHPCRALRVLLLSFLAGCVTEGAPKPESPQKIAEAHTKLGVLYYQKGQLDVALDELDEALKADAGSVHALSALALVRERLGEYDEAENAFRRARELDPVYSENRTNYGVFLCGRGRIKEAIGEFQAAASNPLYAEAQKALFNAGQCLMNHGDPASARSWLEKALAKDPQMPEALLAFAQAAYAAGDYGKAEEALDRYHALRLPDASSIALSRKIAQSKRGFRVIAPRE